MRPIESKILLYKSIFTQIFLFDKFLLSNIYNCPKLDSIVIYSKFLSDLKVTNNFYRLLVLLYLTTGQKPQILIRTHSIRGLKKKKLSGLWLTLRHSIWISEFFFARQLPLSQQFYPIKLNSLKPNFLLKIVQRIQDDDFLSQVLKFEDSFVYNINVYGTVGTVYQAFHSLLISYKIPCRVSVS